MRVIKFRGKRLDNGEWLYGSLSIIYGDRAAILPPNVINHYRVFPATIGQFTGLTDKNGVEIFEGDILRSFHFKDGKKINYLYHIVEWCDRLTGWLARNTSNLQYDPAQHGNPQLWVYVKNADFEVIGSTHDNPKLLKNE